MFEDSFGRIVRLLSEARFACERKPTSESREAHHSRHLSVKLFIKKFLASVSTRSRSWGDDFTLAAVRFFCARSGNPAASAMRGLVSFT